MLEAQEVQRTQVETRVDVERVRAMIRILERQRVFVWDDWLLVLSWLALYNARSAWQDCIRRMNTARRNATLEVWR